MDEANTSPLGGEWWAGSDDDANCVFTTRGGDQTELVCEVGDCDCDPDKQLATAKLIAAAPTLLKAGVDLMNAVDGPAGSHKQFRTAQARMIAAIAKATGVDSPAVGVLAEESPDVTQDLLTELRDTALWLESRAEVLVKLLADPAGWGKCQAVTDKRQVIRDEVARLQGRVFLIRQTISKATEQGA
jgi:hypothetical protein